MKSRICIFGDSITWGAFDLERGGWVERVRGEMMKQGVKVFNLGISSDDSGRMLARFDVEAAARAPDAIVFAVGMCDSQCTDTPENHRVPIAQYERNLATLLEKARAITPRVLFVGLTRVDESKTVPLPDKPTKSFVNASVEAYDAALRAFCEKYHVPYIDVADAFDPASVQDGLHPDAAGHKAMFQRIFPQITSLIA